MTQTGPQNSSIPGTLPAWLAPHAVEVAGWTPAPDSRSCWVRACAQKAHLHGLCKTHHTRAQRAWNPRPSQERYRRLSDAVSAVAFTDWLRQQSDRPDPVGGLARDFIDGARHGRHGRRYATATRYRAVLEGHSPSQGTLASLDRAAAEWRADPASRTDEASRNPETPPRSQ